MRGAILLICAMAAGCGNGSAPTAPPPPASPSPPAAPTSWAISGQVLAAPQGTPIPGASMTFGEAAPVSTDASGNFTIVTTDAATRSLLIGAPGYWTRETSLTGGERRSGVLFDLIGDAPAFPRSQYLELARNAYEAPGKHEPTRRWTANPNIYISTRWREGEQAVGQQSIDFLISEIKRIIPQWTAGKLQAGTIETGFGARALAKGWIHVEFGRSGNWSRLGEDPGQVQFGTEGTCISFAIVHEFGHALGYWHSSVKPSIMGGGQASCALYDLTPNEALIARVMYSREPGNLEPDRDGPPPPPPVYTLETRRSISSGVGRCDRLFD